VQPGRLGPRAVWKGPFVAVQLLQEVAALAQRHPEWWAKGRFQGIRAPEVINTQSRASTILPDFLRLRLGVHNGKSYVPVEVTEAMVGHRLGEFAATRIVSMHAMTS
jgi:small subunit ribosomal protein S19